jgi:phenylacetate-CoA ligase
MHRSGLIGYSRQSPYRLINQVATLGLKGYFLALPFVQECLQRLIVHACCNVPYYRDRYASHLHPGQLQLRNLPVLRRTDLRDHFVDLISRSKASGQVADDCLFLSHTSGSTGIPASHLKTEQSEKTWDLALLSRLFSEAGLPFCGTLYDLGLHWRGQPIVECRLIPGAYICWNFMNMGEMGAIDDYLEIMSITNPTVIFGAPSRIADLAHLCNEKGIIKRPKLVITSFEQLLETTRRFLHEAFGCKVVSVYGTAELGICGWECSRGRIHFQDDVILPEVIGEEGNPVAHGQVGRLIITSLKSWVMPLIRYETGDLAIAARDLCDCGAQSTSILALEGRSASRLFTKTTRAVSSYKMMSCLENLNVSGFQIVQATPGSVMIVVGEDDQVSADALHLIQRKIEEWLGEPFLIAVDPSGRFTLTPGGKRNPVVQLCNYDPSWMLPTTEPNNGRGSKGSCPD